MKRGFTLIEVMVAAAILGIGCLGVLAMMVTTIEFNAASHDRTNAVYLAEQQLSRLEVLAANPCKWSNGTFSATVVTGDGLENPTPGGDGGTAVISTDWHFLAPASGMTFPSDYQIAIRQHDPDDNADEIIGAFFGELRVIWSTNGVDCGTDASVYDVLSTAKNTTNQHCAFVTLPFVLNQPGTTCTFSQPPGG